MSGEAFRVGDRDFKYRTNVVSMPNNPCWLYIPTADESRSFDFRNASKLSDSWKFPPTSQGDFYHNRSLSASCIGSGLSREGSIPMMEKEFDGQFIPFVREPVSQGA